MNGLDATTTDIDFGTIPIAIFVGDRFLVARHQCESVSIDAVWTETMKVLMVVTVIFLPLTLLVGIYGMNFEHMPELEIENAYFVFLGVMASIVVGLLLLFRIVRWL